MSSIAIKLEQSVLTGLLDFVDFIRLNLYAYFFFGQLLECAQLDRDRTAGWGTNWRVLSDRSPQGPKMYTSV